MTFTRNENGSALVEFALILTIITTMMVGGLDLAVAVQQDMQVADSVRAGAEYALTWGNETNIAQMQAVATASANGLASYQVVAQNICSCPPSGPPVSCASVCSNYGQPALFAQVTATATLKLPFGGYASIPVSSVAKVRISCPSCY